MATEPQRLLRDLKALLKEEREALLTGDLAQIASLTSKKAALLRSLPETDMSIAALSEISDDIERNQALLRAAQSGLKSAEDTVGRMNAGLGQSFVYDRSGVVSNLRSDRPSLSQKL